MRGQTIAEQFARIVNLFPLETAVREGDSSISYQDLGKRSQELCALILERDKAHPGVGEKSPVALYLPSSIDFVIAMLACAQSGHPYLPLDMKYPADRIKVILDLAQCDLVITSSIYSDSLPEGNRQILAMDRLPVLSDFGSFVPPVIQPDDIAYIIFTSGSTGTPKGATLRHENLLNAVYWTYDFFDMQAGATIAQLARTVFDASVWEFWMSLLLGGRLIISPQEIMLDQDELRRIVRDYEIEYMFLGTPVGELFMREKLLPGSKLKWLWPGGDRLLQRPIQEFAARVGNIYGPTECTIVSTCEIVEPGAPDDIPAIGFPIANCRIYILNEKLEPVPQGELGEICITGAGVGNGYYNEPELTAKVFLPDPFSDQASSILYRSGDLGRYREDGKLECVGRLDTQVKIRGYRIELGEIEAVLNTHQRLRDLIVLAEGESNEKELYVFYSSVDNHEIPGEELADLAKAKLPDYMVPRHYILVTELPLTANGKIDRRALLRLIPKRDEVGDYDLPITDFEVTVAGIWSDILKVRKINLSDRFYDLGGHSIKAAQLINAIRTKLQVDVKLGALFANPSLAEFCKTLSGLKASPELIIPHIEDIHSYPLAYDQLGLWYYWQVDPQRQDYLICLRFDVKGCLDVDILKAALLFLQDRHPIMKVGFKTVLGKPEQYFREHQELDFQYHKIEAEHPSQEQNAVVKQGYHQLFPYPHYSADLLRIEADLQHKVFDLEHDALYRTCVLDFGNQTWTLLMNVHHIITDGWSMGIWQKEFVKVYQAMLLGTEIRMNPLSLNYGDYCLWQMQLDPIRSYPEQYSFWLDTLSPPPPKLELPLRLTPVAENCPQGRRYWWKLGTELSRELRQTSRQAGISLFATLLGLFKILLSRYTGQQDIAVMSVFSGRTYTQTKTLLGLLTNLFFVRSLINPEANLKEQIISENQACTNALQNLDYPFEKLIQDLWPDHEQRNAALGNIYFILQNYPLDNKEEGDLQIKMLDIGADSAKFDILMTIEEDNEELYCWIEYRTALYEEALIQRLAGQFSRLCQLYVQNPELALDDLDVLLPEEREQLLLRYNSSSRDFPLDRTYIEMWRQNLAGFANRKALVCPEGEYSYADLEARSNQLANYLWGLGAESGVTIAICLPRGIWLASAMLAIWKLGAAYLPLDPKYPVERLLYMVNDAGIRLILGDSQFRDIFEPVCNTDSFLTATIFIAVDEEEETILQQTCEFDVATQNSAACAYLIYSSGSTGKPKGVMVSQRNLLNHNLAVIEAFGLHQEDRVLQFGSISFDLSIEEIFPTWLAGACLIFRTDEVLHSFESFWSFAESNRISVIDIPTAFWHALVDELDSHRMTPDLRLCIIGGEKAMPEKLDIWHRHSRGKVRLLNTYGPTETTIIATLHEADAERNHQYYPIGKPIANVQAYVLDDQLRLLPATAKGELCIGGEGVGMGYLNLPELTRKSFIPDPFNNRNGAFLYRTGDLAAWDENGELHFWGRIDNQIKLLGHRIEPSEIEILLRSHPQIKDAAVVLRDDATGNPCLTAYLIYREAELTNPELRSYLAQELPDYMIPSSFTALESFPLSPAGKLDLKALPAPQVLNNQPDKEFVGYYTPEQEVLCRTIAEVLNLERVSVKDNFFALGGNSILSLQLIQKLRYAGLQLNVEQLFQSANVEDLAAGMRLLQVSDNSYGSECLIELKKGSLDKPVLVLVHSLPGDVLGYVNLVHKLPADLAVYGLQALGLINPEKAHHSIEEMADFYLEVLKAQAFPCGFHLAGWCFGGRVAVEMALKFRMHSKHIPRVFLFETYAYNPVNSLRVRYMLYRSSLILRNHRRMKAIIRRKLKQIAPALPGTSQAEIFLETGIFRNRAQVRQINIKAIFSSKLRYYPWELVLFKARVQDPNMLQDPSLGWKVFAPKIKIFEVDSTHENILKDPQVDSIAAMMNELLA